MDESGTVFTNTSIGVFDSGMGGLTVLKSLLDKLPQFDYCYFGDTARVPYGNKSANVIQKYSLEIADILMRNHPSCIIVACNTASAYASKILEERLPVPVVNMITPSVEELRGLYQVKKVAILATKATVKSGRYEEEIQRQFPLVKVYSQACPLFVPLIEEGYIDHPIMQKAIEEHLCEIKSEGVDTVILACTHYPLIKKEIQEYFGAGVRIIDSANACARHVSNIFEERTPMGSVKRNGKLDFIISDDPEDFKAKGERYLNRVITNARHPSYFFTIDQEGSSQCSSSNHSQYTQRRAVGSF